MLQQIIRYLPLSIKQHLGEASNRRVLANMAWLVGDKLFRMGGGLLVGVLIARYLGPQQFGLFNFAFAFVWLFSFVATLGLDEILIREVVEAPLNADRIAGTGLVLKTAGSLLALGSIAGVFFLMPNYNAYHFSVILVMALSMLIRSVDVLRLWFESKVMSKYIVLAENIAFILSSLLKVGFIFFHAPLMAFIWATVVEMGLAGLLLVYFFRKRGNAFSQWHFNKPLAKSLLRDSWPLIIAGLSISIYVKCDQVLLTLLAGETETGIYSAAARISEIWYFLPTSIVVSMFPKLMSSKKQSSQIYNRQMQQLFDSMTLLSLLIALPMTFLSPWVMTLLFGAAYKGGSTVLSIHIWSGVFVFLGVASSRVLVAENLQTNQFYRSLIGAILNILLNLVLIPVAGGVGSAIATVISYGASVFSAFLFPKIRPIARMMLASFHFFRIYKQYANK